MEAVRHLLDFPGVNCRQCGENLKTDGTRPPCGTCKVATWDGTTNLALALHNLASPDGEIDARWMEKGMDRLQIPGYRRPLFARLALAIHGAITEHRTEMIKAEREKYGRQ